MTADGPNGPYRVMVADDVAALRRLIRIGLEESGQFQVVAEAENGALAVEKAAQERPDLVLLDLSMPQMDGLEALPRIMAASPESRVVVFSGFNHARMAPVALRMGASAYLEKGMEPRTLIQRLLGVLEGGPAAAPSGDAAGPARPPPPPPPPAPPGGGPPLPLLLVTADASLRDRLQRLLGRPILAVAEAGGVGALVETTHCQAILFDAPAFGAAATEALIQALGVAGTAPVIQLVTSLDSPEAQAGLKLGVEDCLPRDPLVGADLQRSILYATERLRGRSAERASRDQAREIRRLKELEQLKMRFYNMAAHEINTPLTPIQLQVHLLKAAEHDLRPEHARAVHILDRNVKRLGRLAAGLLDVARLQTGRIRLTRKSADIGHVIEEVVDTFDVVARHAGIDLRANVGPGGCDGCVDAPRIQQVLYNLVSNAIKYTPRGGHVAIEAVAEGDDALVVRVKDTGIGFTPEQAVHLFEPFSRLHADAARDPGGNGLGLYVCKGLVELHGGTIQAESAGPGMGATFWFRIPKGDVGSDRGPRPSATSPPHGAPLAPARPPRPAPGARFAPRAGRVASAAA